MFFDPTFSCTVPYSFLIWELRSLAKIALLASPQVRACCASWQFQGEIFVLCFFFINKGVPTTICIPSCKTYLNVLTWNGEHVERCLSSLDSNLKSHDELNNGEAETLKRKNILEANWNADHFNLRRGDHWQEPPRVERDRVRSCSWR